MKIHFQIIFIFSVFYAVLSGTSKYNFWGSPKIFDFLNRLDFKTKQVENIINLLATYNFQSQDYAPLNQSEELF